MTLIYIYIYENLGIAHGSKNEQRFFYYAPRWQNYSTVIEAKYSIFKGIFIKTQS